jgi:hypothetical protein
MPAYDFCRTPGRGAGCICCAFLKRNETHPRTLATAWSEVGRYAQWGVMGMTRPL